MSNVTTLKKGGGTVGSAAGNGPGPVKMTHEIDIADAVAAGLATTNLVTLVSLPADTYFRLLQVEVVTDLSLGAGARIDVGDTDDDDEFVSNATTLTAGTNLTLLKGDGSLGDVYTAAKDVALKVTGGTIASGKLRFVWLQMDTSRNPLAEA